VRRVLAIAAEQFKHPLFIALHSKNGINQAYRQDSPDIPPIRLSGDDVDLTKPITLYISDRAELETGDKMLMATISDTDGGMNVEYEQLMYDPSRKLN
jgi:hypothetical protein